MYNAKNTDKMKAEERNPETGLTSTQEEAVKMLMAGDSVATIADKLKVSESTLYKWQETLTFQCYYNKQCKNAKANLKDSLLAMYEKALSAIKSSMESDNEMVKLKTATWLIEKISTFSYGNGNPVGVIRERCYEENAWSEPTFNEEKFQKLLAENGLAE